MQGKGMRRVAWRGGGPVPAEPSGPGTASAEPRGVDLLLEAGTREDDQRVIAGRTQPIGAALLSERAHLLPLVAEGFDLASVHFPTVNASGCVRVLTNFYSTPLAAGTAVQVKVYASYVKVWYQRRCVAQHERSYGHQQKYSSWSITRTR